MGSRFGFAADDDAWFGDEPATNVGTVNTMNRDGAPPDPEVRLVTYRLFGITIFSVETEYYATE